MLNMDMDLAISTCLFLTVLANFNLVSSHSLPIVDPGLFVIHGVRTCGQGQGYCLLSNSCTVDTDFENDIEGGHCEGLKHAFNPNADFICCAFKPPTTTDDETTTDSHSTPLLEETPPPPSTTPSEMNTTERNNTKLQYPLNAAANTNKILSHVQHLLQGGRMRPAVAAIPSPGKDQPEFFFNDKSMLNLILLGMNELPITTTPSL